MTWGFAERQAKSPVPGYRGTVLISPAASPIDITEEAVKNPTLPWAIPGLALAELTIASVNAVYPSYNLSGYTAQAYDIFHNAYEPYQVCLPTSNILFGPIITNITKTGWQNTPEVMAWQNLTRVGNKRFAGPLLIMAGNYHGSDGIIPYDGPFKSAILTTAHELCDMNNKSGWGESLEVVGYSGVSHFSVIQASEGMWLDWIKKRVRGVAPAPRAGCRFRNMEAFRDGNATDQVLAPNFLVELPYPQGSWQYTL